MQNENTEERANIITLELIHEHGLWNRLNYNDDDLLLAMRVRELITTFVSERTIRALPPVDPILVQSLRDCWLANVSWTKVARAVRERYAEAKIT